MLNEVKHLGSKCDFAFVSQIFRSTSFRSNLSLSAAKE
jgi:hypothetical protein